MRQKGHESVFSTSALHKQKRLSAHVRVDSSFQVDIKRGSPAEGHGGHATRIGTYRSVLYSTTTTAGAVRRMPGESNAHIWVLEIRGSKSRVGQSTVLFCRAVGSREELQRALELQAFSAADPVRAVGSEVRAECSWEPGGRNHGNRAAKATGPEFPQSKTTCT